MYYPLGICLMLAALLSLNLLLTGCAAVLWRAVKRKASWSAQTRAKVLFRLCTVPPVCAALITAALIAPAYFIHEPYSTNERIGIRLWLLALAAASGICLALSQFVRSWLKTRRLVADWLRRAEVVHIEGVAIPTYRLRHRFPVVAVVGTLKPRLFVAEQIFDRLDKEELTAAIRHEVGHLAARDTLKGVFMRVCRDLLWLAPFGREFERQWAEESESAADEYAARNGGGLVALELAAGLVKIARMIPADDKRASSSLMPAGAFLLQATTGGGGVAQRVNRLTELATRDARSEDRLTLLQSRFPKRKFLSSVAPLAIATFVFTATVAAPQALHATHLLIERVVRALA